MGIDVIFTTSLTCRVDKVFSQNRVGLGGTPEDDATLVWIFFHFALLDCTRLAEMMGWVRTEQVLMLCCEYCPCEKVVMVLQARLMVVIHVPSRVYSYCIGSCELNTMINRLHGLFQVMCCSVRPVLAYRRLELLEGSYAVPLLQLTLWTLEVKISHPCKWIYSTRAGMLFVSTW